VSGGQPNKKAATSHEAAAFYQLGGESGIRKKAGFLLPSEPPNPLIQLIYLSQGDRI
jgi:hypothetical protein